MWISGHRGLVAINCFISIESTISSGCKPGFNIFDHSSRLRTEISSQSAKPPPMQAASFFPDCTERWQMSAIQTVADTTSIMPNVQRSESPKAVITTKDPPEAKKIKSNSITEKRKQPGRKRRIAKGKLAKKGARIPLPVPLTDTDIADLILKNGCKNIIVLAGAGISTNSGIPDFRSPGTGIYDNLMEYNVPYPEAIFDIDYFTNNPKPFFTLAKELYPGKYQPNFVHYFIKLLHDKGLLLRCYTQNIDGLERMAGIPPEKLVEAHGTFSTASCHLCYTPFPAEEAQECIISGTIPRCKICSGFVKPDIVFFGENLPQRYHDTAKDFSKADLLIIMGTSLQIDPFASLVNAVRCKVPRLLLNRDLVGPFTAKRLKSTDVAILGDLADITKKFVSALNWQTEMEELMKSDHTDTRH